MRTDASEEDRASQLKQANDYLGQQCKQDPNSPSGWLLFPAAEDWPVLCRSHADCAWQLYTHSWDSAPHKSSDTHQSLGAKEGLVQKEPV